MSNEELFEQNIKRWELIVPNSAKDMAEATPGPYKFTETTKGEPNLCWETDEFFGNLEYIHSQTGAFEEAQQWFDQQDLRNINVLYVYGIGLGYVYDAAQKWLKDPANYIVFLEDDLSIIYHFLHTETASRLLHDTQARLYHISSNRPFDDVWMNLSNMFGARNFRIGALDYYLKRPKDMLSQIHTSLSFWQNLRKAIISEYSTYGQHYYTNFYQNIHYLPHAYRASELFGKFKGVPAIICGAGPSLDKNLALLEKLGDRALIFAGATAMNAVNARGFLPHFGLGIDPNPGQFTRLVMNTAYEVPFLYRQRFNPEARAILHGPPVYVTGSGGYHVSKWLEKALSIDGEDVDEGCNVVNFSLALAHAFGCNPIIFVGLDLAYSEGRSYQSGVESHPTHTRRRDFRTKTIEEDLVTRLDIFGNPVSTLWKWIAESLWFAQFAIAHPDTLFINATEGGIGIPGVPNKPLCEVAEYLFLRQLELPLRVHGELQNSEMPAEVNWKNIQKHIQEMEESMIKSQEYCESILEESLKLAHEIEEGQKEATSNLMTEEAQANYDKLVQEIAYKSVLEDFNEYYQPAVTLDYQKIAFDHFISAGASAAKRAKLQADRFKFLRTAAMINRALIKIYALQPSPMESFEALTAIPTPRSNTGEQYSFDGRELVLNDSELNLSIHDTLSAEEEVTQQNLYYPDGSIKFEQTYLKNVLHGPVTFFDNTGKVLGQSWYVRGKQQGKSWLYYHDGTLYSVQRFCDGLWNGTQEFYYRDGKLKTKMIYHNGRLDGDVRLFHPNGKQKLELYFVNGKRHGIERMWNLNGLLIIEAEYQNGRPTGSARTYHENGKLAQLISYDDNGAIVKLQCMDTNGIPIEEPKPDYFDWITAQTQYLTRSLGDVFKELKLVVPLASKIPSMQDNVIQLQEQMTHLEDLGQNLLQESGLDGSNTLEPIWKSPQAFKDMQKQLEESTNKLKQEMENMHRLIEDAQNRLKQQSEEIAQKKNIELKKLESLKKKDEKKNQE